MNETADVAIIGAGIIGLNIAYQLVRRAPLKVVVLEKGSGLGEGSTGASSAVCRFRYSRPEMVELAKDGIHAYRNWGDYVELSSPRAQFHRDGVLWLGTSDTGWASAEQDRLGQFGLRTEVLDDAELRSRFPAVNPCIVPPDLVNATEHDCRGGSRHLLEVDGGYFDPVDALQDMLDAVRARGVAVRFNTPVQEICTENGRASGVALAGGSRISAPMVVNASGPWCNQFYARLGLEIGWPLVPTRIQVIHLDRPTSVTGEIPVVVDPSAGIYFRTQNRGQQIIVSTVLEEDEREEVSPDEFNRQVDRDFELAKLHALQHRLPQLSIRNVTGYCGLYTVNRSDVHPILGETAVAGVYAANGCSGHGFKLAPALGAYLARQIAGPTATFDTGISADFLAVTREPIVLPTKNVLA